MYIAKVMKLIHHLFLMKNSFQMIKKILFVCSLTLINLSVSNTINAQTNKSTTTNNVISYPKVPKFENKELLKHMNHYRSIILKYTPYIIKNDEVKMEEYKAEMEKISPKLFELEEKISENDKAALESYLESIFAVMDEVYHQANLETEE